MSSVGPSRPGRGRGWYRPASLWLSALAAMVAFTALGFVVVNRGVALALPVPGPAFVAMQLVSTGVWLAAALMMLRRSDLAWSPLAAVAGLSHALAALGSGWATYSATPGHHLGGLDVGVWLCVAMLPIEVPVVVWMTVTVPDGRLAPRWLGRVGAASVALAATGVALLAVAPLEVADTDVAGAVSPFAGGWAVGGVAPLLLIAGALIGDVVVVVRWRRATGADRLVLRLVAVLSVGGVVILPLLFAGPAGLGVAAAQVASVVLILAFISAIGRHQLLGIERVLDRSLRYLTLSALLAVAYVGLVAAGEQLMGGTVGLVAAVAVALIALPLRDRVASSITRFVYGRRRDTQALVAGIARDTLHRGSPGELLVGALMRLSDGLDIEWMAVRTLHRPGADVEVGTHPAHRASITCFELVHRGRALGSLDVGRHGDGEDLDETDHAVLTEILPHLAMVVESVLSAAALRQARDRLVQTHRAPSAHSRSAVHGRGDARARAVGRHGRPDRRERRRPPPVPCSASRSSPSWCSSWRCGSAPSTPAGGCTTSSPPRPSGEP